MKHPPDFADTSVEKAKPRQGAGADGSDLVVKVESGGAVVHENEYASGNKA